MKVFPKILAVLLLLVDAVICQRLIELGTENSETCEFPFDTDQLEQHDLGTRFRIYCNAGCVRASMQRGSYALFGTTLYSLDSELCLAAVHDARLPHPALQQGVAAVDFTISSHEHFLTGSFKRGLLSGNSEYEAHVVKFTSDKVVEAVPDITTIHTHFRRNGDGTTYLECHVGGVTEASEVRIFDTNGGPEDSREKADARLVQLDGGLQKTVASVWEDQGFTSPSWFLCRIDSAAYSDTISVEYVDNGYFRPQRSIYRANRGDNVSLRATDSYTRTFKTYFPTWTREGFRTVAQDTIELRLRNVQEASTGVYWLQFPTTRSYSSATRLVVRGCPAGQFGEDCLGRCPFCLHGGVCHDVTGQCVCPPGFFGTRCQHGCEDGRLGRDCWSRCPQDSCGARLLCAPDPYGCSCGPGWSGRYCSSRCRVGRYGPNCEFFCGSCSSRYCNRFSGKCNQRGCSDSSLLPPLCQPLWPWFREPPTVEQVSYTSITVTHQPWSQEYDNGFGSGSGSYRYQVQRRPSGDAGVWTPTERTIPHPGLTGERLLRFSLTGLEPDTKYQIRIIIQDLNLKASQEDETKVPTVEAATDCAGIMFSTSFLEVQRLDSTSVSASISPLKNEDEVCSYNLNLTISSKSPMARGQASRIISQAERSTLTFSGLSPFTAYTLVLEASNRKGSVHAPPLDIKTTESAPSEVRKLEVSKVFRHRYRITWQPPSSRNGIIRRYVLIVSHERFLACSSGGPRDTSDTVSRSISATQQEAVLTLKQPFSLYTVSVSAITVAAGPQAAANVSTPPAAPSVFITPGVSPSTTSARVSWQWPPCTAWGDSLQNLRLGVEVRGVSSWNKQELSTQNLTYQHLDLENLTPFSNYSLHWTFYNSVGGVETPAVTPVRTLSTVPGDVRDVAIVTVTPTSVTLQWRPPVPPYSEITSYFVRVRRTSRTYDEAERKFAATSVCLAATRPICEAALVDLQELTEYRFTNPTLPASLSLVGRTQTSLNVSWLEPELKNGQLRGFLLNVTLDESGSGGRHRRQLQVPRSYHVPPHRESRAPGEDPEPYNLHVADLQPGHSYLISVAANTSAGYGGARSARLDTLVAPPVLSSPPLVRSGSTTGTTVELVVPTADATGGPVSAYYVVVSSDPAFEGAELSPQHLPNVQESLRNSLRYYVAAALDQERLERSNVFVVGDGRYYNDSVAGGAFQNAPLTEGASYRLGVAVLSRLADDNQQLSFRRVSDTFVADVPINGAVVVGVLAMIAFLFLLTLLGAVVIWKRGHQTKTLNAEGAALNGQAETTRGGNKAFPLEPLSLTANVQKAEEVNLMEDEEDCAIYENLQISQINYTRIEVADLVEATRNGINSGMLKAQLQSVPHGVVQPCECGQQTPNKKKNRYINLLPYDHSRVVLERLADDKYSDYINANYVDGYKRSRAYIACQGPKKETVFDFWRMVWQEGTQRIVMLTNLVEGGKRKCDQYWPDQQPLQLPGMTVVAVRETACADHTVRVFEVTNRDVSRTVTHLHYTAWPDHSVPQRPSSLARFMRALDAVADGGAPTVVHCSAGVGRTGTVILIDAMHQMGRREQAVDVYAQLSVVRQQRANLCANYEQYKLVHQVLVALLAAPDSTIPAAELASRLAALRTIEYGDSSALQQQWTFLQKTRPHPSCASALADSGVDTNRDLGVLPEDRSRVYLDRSMPDCYVNAVYVTGYLLPDALIATEAPLPGRAAQLWHMVAQKLTSTVIVLNDLQPQDVFWPDVGKNQVYTNLTVDTKSTSQSGDITNVDLQLRVFNADQLTETRQVRLLRLTEPADGLPSAAGLTRLREELNRAPAGGAPSVVVCRDGVTGCGLFVTACYLLEQLSEEQELDAVAAVEAVRCGRPQFIANVEQFELCYKVAVWWLEAFATYSNFQ